MAVVVVVVADLALDPGLGLDLAPGIARGLGLVPNLAPGHAPGSRKKRTLNLDPVPSRGLRSDQSLAPDQRGGASLVLALVRSLVQGQDPAPSLVTREEIQNPGPGLNQRKGPSPAPALERNPSLVLALPTQNPSLGLGLDPSPEVTSAPHLDPAARIEKPRKLAVTQNPNLGLDPNLQLKMVTSLHTEISQDPDQKLQRKWKKMAGIQLPLIMATTRSVIQLLPVKIKINVIFSSSVCLEEQFVNNFAENPEVLF